MTSRARKLAIIERAETVPETMSESNLRMDVETLLYAFELAELHVKKGGTYATRLAEQQELALGLIDWAICECDRGADLLKVKTKPDELAK